MYRYVVSNQYIHTYVYIYVYNIYSICMNHTLILKFRLNYPLRMRQWHHMCSSWNGKTGEWQVWLKAERIGRGFHNSVSNLQLPKRDGTERKLCPIQETN